MSEVRLIDANALKTRINNVPMHGDADVFYEIMGELVSVVASAPTVDAEVVRHGRWHRDSSLTNYGCTSYGARSWDRWDYCPFCGAKMDAKEDA